MSRSFWVIVFALGLVLFTSLGQAQENADDKDRQADQEQTSAEYMPAPFRVEIVEDQAEVDYRQNREQKSDKREIDDLIAQQGMNEATQAMNNATQKMADLAYWQTLLVGIGTVLLFVTLWFTRQANLAAQNAVKVTREVGEAQSRAYLSITGAHLTWDKGMDYPGLCITLKNSGQSPARNIEAVVRFQFYPAGKTASKISPSDRHAVLWHSDLSAGDEETPPTMFLSDAAIEKDVWGQSLENMAGVHIDIVVYADDVFDKEITAYKHFTAGWRPEIDRFQRHEMHDFGSIFSGKIGSRFTESLRVHLNKRREV